MNGMSNMRRPRLRKTLLEYIDLLVVVALAAVVVAALVIQIVDTVPPFASEAARSERER